MKKVILSFLACLTCCIFCLSPVSAFGASINWVDIILDTIFSELIQGSVEGENNGSDGKGLTGLAEQWIDNSIIPGLLDTVYQTADNSLSFTVPNYRIVTGKYQLKSTFANYSGDDVTTTVQDDVLVECTLLVCDRYDSKIDYTLPFGIDKNTGVSYYANSLNYTIYYTDGTIDRFVCVYRNNIYSQLSGFGSSFLSLSQGNYCDVYDYHPTHLQRVLYTNQWSHGFRFYMNQSNSITRELTTIAPRPSSPDLLSTPSYFSTWSSTSSKSRRLTIKEWAEGRASVVYLRPTSSTSSNRDYAVNFYPTNFFYTSFAITNNNTDENSINSNWTSANYQNYYIDNTYEGGKVINTTNNTTILGGALAPAFDIDTDLPFDEILSLLTALLPDIKANLKPQVGFDIESLFDRLFDFYSNMPGIGLPWGDDDTNNYWDVQPPAVPDDGGSGDITVNVDITRPLVPKVTTNYWLDLDVGTQTTITYPVALVSAAPQVFEKADEVVNTLEIMPLIGLLAVFSIAVAILFKGV